MNLRLASVTLAVTAGLIVGLALPVGVGDPARPAPLVQCVNTAGPGSFNTCARLDTSQIEDRTNDSNTDKEN